MDLSADQVVSLAQRLLDAYDRRTETPALTDELPELSEADGYRIQRALVDLFRARGARIVELFKQPAFNPIPIELQVAILFAMQRGFFDPIEVRKVMGAAQSMKEFFTARKDALLTEIRTKAALDKDLEARLQTACEEWKGSFNG